jgi:hypothetical protein
MTVHIWGRGNVATIDGNVIVDSGAITVDGEVTLSDGVNTLENYSAESKSQRFYEVNPLDRRRVPSKTVLTNIATNTTDYLYYDMNGYRYITMQGKTSGTAPTDVLTCTLEMSSQDDGTAPGSCEFIDVTNQFTGQASYVDTDFLWAIEVPLAVKYVALKYVTSNDSGNDCDLTAYVVRIW